MVSIFASAVRSKLFPYFLNSLESTTEDYEVIFAGKCDVNVSEFEALNIHQKRFMYIKTDDIKPAQCYEIARRACRGEVVVWVADDCEFPNDVIGKAYRFWKSENNEKLIISIQTRESGYGLPQGQLFDMRQHRFFGGNNNTPIMAPLGMMSRRFLDTLGGLDVRYIAGQYENDIVMRAYAQGGSVKIYGDETCFIDIDHLGKSYLTGESRVMSDFVKRPFATAYPHDRKILEGSWVKNGVLLPNSYRRFDEFIPYKDENLLTKNQSYSGIWGVEDDLRYK